MNTPFLKNKTVEVNDIHVVIYQLSGLDRFDFVEYTSELKGLKKPEPIAEDAAPEVIDEYWWALTKWQKSWSRATFIGQARLVAYGLYRSSEYEGKSIDEVHQYVMSSMKEEHIKSLHDEVAIFSGIPLPKQEETQNVDNGEQEEFDPKN